MGRFSDVEEVLRVFAPELVLFPFLIYAHTSSSLRTPLALKLLFNGRLELGQLDRIRRENTQKEWPLLILPIVCLRVRDDHVVHGLLLVLGREDAVLGYFSLPLIVFFAVDCLENDVILVDLPEPVFLGLDSNDHEVDGYVWALGYLLVLLHYA